MKVMSKSMAAKKNIPELPPTTLTSWKVIDLDSITDLEKLKSMLADQFLAREKAKADSERAMQNIQKLIDRINQVDQELSENG